MTLSDCMLGQYWLIHLIIFLLPANPLHEILLILRDFQRAKQTVQCSAAGGTRQLRRRTRQHRFVALPLPSRLPQGAGAVVSLNQQKPPLSSPLFLLARPPKLIPAVKRASKERDARGRNSIVTDGNEHDVQNTWTLHVSVV